MSKDDNLRYFWFSPSQMSSNVGRDFELWCGGFRRSGVCLAKGKLYSECRSLKHGPPQLKDSVLVCIGTREDIVHFSYREMGVDQSLDFGAWDELLDTSFEPPPKPLTP